MGRQSVVLIGALPPPLHGQSQMTQRLLDASASWEFPALHPVNARYADSLEDMITFSWRKVGRLFRYLGQMVGLIFAKRASAVILSPAFYKGPFLKDSLFIWAAWLLRRRVIAWFQMDYGGVDPSAWPTWFRLWQKLTLLRCHRFVCCTQAVVHTLPAYLPRQKVSALPNGMPDPNPALHERSADFRITYLSTMFGAKGWKVLLEAAEKICSRHSHVSFHFYGPPSIEESEEQLREIFEASPAAQRIHYHGSIHGEAKHQMLANSRLFCLPSFTEAFPLVLLEAMAAALPIIATKVGGIPDALDTKGGWLVPPNDAQALESALEAALADPTALLEKGNHNRKKFLSRYTLEAFASRWQTFLASNA